MLLKDQIKEIRVKIVSLSGMQWGSVISYTAELWDGRVVEINKGEFDYWHSVAMQS
jgi:hypothetical protein